MSRDWPRLLHAETRLDCSRKSVRVAYKICGGTMVGNEDRGRQRAAHVKPGRPDESESHSKYNGKTAEKFSQGEELI